MRGLRAGAAGIISGQRESVNTVNNLVGPTPRDSQLRVGSPLSQLSPFQRSQSSQKSQGPKGTDAFARLNNSHCDGKVPDS